jgi:arginine/ornithine transport system permease protein
MRHAVPGFGNNWLVLAKTTALVSVIGLHDMVHNAAQAGGAVREPFTFFFIVALLFLLMTTLSEVLLAWLARRVSAGVRRV